MPCMIDLPESLGQIKGPPESPLNMKIFELSDVLLVMYLDIHTISTVFILFHWHLTLQGPLSFPPAQRLSSPIFWAWSPQSSMHSFWPMIGIVTTCNSSGLVTPFWSVFPHPEFSHCTPSKMRFWQSFIRGWMDLCGDSNNILIFSIKARTFYSFSLFW